MTEKDHDMNACCALCHDPLDLVTWQHPDTGENMEICSFCARSIIGTCHECGELIVSVDRYAVDEKGFKICSKCADGHERADEKAAP